MRDLISRQAALDIINHELNGWLTDDERLHLEGVGTGIELLPSAQPKKGKWIWDDEGYHCSECFFHAHGNTLECLDGTYSFCPNCGADMRGEE